MNLALAVDCWRDRDLIFAQSFSATHVLALASAPPEPWAWDEAGMAALRNRVEKGGMTLAGLEEMPVALRDAVDGGPGREAEVEACRAAVRAAGRAGIPLIGYRWQRAGQSGVAPTARARGDAPAWSVRLGTAQTKAARVRREALRHFLDRVLPEAEGAGVRLAFRPCLATASEPLAVAATADGLADLLAETASPWHGLDLDHAAVRAAGEADLAAVIRRLGRGRLFAAEVDNPVQSGEELRQAFPDEGDTDLAAALAAYGAVGFDGTIRPGLTPGMVGDSEWGHKGRAFAMGYLRAVLQALASPANRRAGAGAAAS